MSFFDHAPVRTEWRAAFLDYQRQLAHRFLIAGAWLALLIVPAFQVADLWVSEATGRLWWDHLFWRLPPMLTGGLVIFLHHVRQLGPGWWTRPLLRLLALSVMFMMVGLMSVHQILETDATELMIRGLIMTTAAVALLSLGGMRDLALIYGLPFFTLLLAFWYADISPLAAINQMLHPLMMAVIGCVIAEMYFRVRIDAFNIRQQLEHTAATDALTGLPNRRSMEWKLEVEHARSQRHKRLYAVLMADIDRFKRVNDTYGHDVGDEVLRELADRMGSAVRTEDEVARWGGEEFMILLPDTGQEEAMVVAEKIRQKVAATEFPTSAGRLSITVSLGAAVYAGEDEPVGVIKRADVALYRAKDNGRNRCEAG